MKNSYYFLIAMFCIGSVSCVAQTREKGPWWPHPIWGAGDQAGGSNWITSEKILKALTLAKTGKLYELGHVYERGMPLVGKRSYNLFIPSFPTYPPTGKDNLLFNDEYITSELGQVGTQFDGPGYRFSIDERATRDSPLHQMTNEKCQMIYGRSLCDCTVRWQVAARPVDRRQPVKAGLLP